MSNNENQEQELLILAEKIKKGEATEEEKLYFHQKFNGLLGEIKSLLQE